MISTKNVIRDICPIMRENDFKIKNKCFYRIDNDLAYCIELEKPSGMVYVNYYIIPLYLPAETRYLTYGDRMKMVLYLGEADGGLYSDWIKQTKEYLLKFVIPEFKRIYSPYNFLDKIKSSGLFNRPESNFPVIDVLRLSFYTELYYRNYYNAKRIGIAYEAAIRSANYLTQTVKEHFLKEIEYVEVYLNDNSQDVDDLVANIIYETQKNCFG